jgi:hypothetical protein
MGIIAKILSVVRVTQGSAKVSSVKSDMGGNTIISGEQFSSPGDDANPLPDDYVALIENARIGGVSAVGYLDPKNQNITQPGEKRIYSRDSSGNIVAEIKLANDGSIRGQNSNGFFELTSAGVFTASSISVTGTIDAGGTISSTSIEVNGKELDGHLHSGVTTGGSNTGPIV